mmetsp:Transcript_57959/g.188523  ORF Transcript_57959/g.188523 Transcript_57959/m.188523 type:complete len:188 (-) Transcript_57959:101-664(-)
MGQRAGRDIVGDAGGAGDGVSGGVGPSCGVGGAAGLGEAWAEGSEDLLKLHVGKGRGERYGAKLQWAPGSPSGLLILDLCAGGSMERVVREGGLWGKVVGGTIFSVNGVAGNQRLMDAEMDQSSIELLIRPPSSGARASKHNAVDTAAAVTDEAPLMGHREDPAAVPASVIGRSSGDSPGADAEAPG